MFCQIKDTLDTFVKLYNTDMTVLFNDCQMMLKFADDLYQPLIDQFIRELTTLLSLVEDAHTAVLLETNQLSGFYRPLSTIYSEIGAQKTGILGKLTVIDVMLSSPNRAIPNNIDFRKLTSEDCRNNIQHEGRALVQTIDEVLLSEIASMTQQQQLLSRLIENVKQFRSLSENCLLEYRQILQQGLNWHSDNNPAIDHIMNDIRALVGSGLTPVSTFLSIKNAADRFDGFVNLYAYSNYSDAGLMYLFPTSGGMSTQVDILRDDVEKAIIHRYQTLIRELSDHMKKVYMQALNTAAQLSAFVRDDYYFGVLYGMTIFKVPMPNLLKPTRYKDVGLELWKSWEPQLSFTNFVDWNAQQVISKSVDSYFNPLLKEVSDFSYFMVTHSNDLKVILENVFADYQRHVAAVNIDEQFVKYVLFYI